MAQEGTTRNRSDTLWIYVKDGKPYVDPSPAVVRRDDKFTIKNFAGGEAEVDFGGVPITPQKPKPFKKSATFKVDSTAGPSYYEYDITLVTLRKGKRVRRRVKGGSRPGVIIDG